MDTERIITRDLGHKAGGDCIAALRRTTELCDGLQQQVQVCLFATVGVLGVALATFRQLCKTEGEDFPPRMLAETMMDKMLRPMVIAVAVGEPSDKAADAILAGLAEVPDPWIEVSTLGEPQPGKWPWNGEGVLIHCTSLHPGYPGPTGEARYREDKKHNEWDWWWGCLGPEDYYANPVSETNGPVTHVRRIVRPVGC